MQTLVKLIPTTVIGLALLLAPEARAQDNVLINKPGVIKHATKAKDEANKKFKLRKGERVLVIYERGKWYWVKTKKDRQGWVKKKNVRLRKGGGAKKPKPGPKAEPVQELLPQEEKSEEGSAAAAPSAEESQVEATPTVAEEAATPAPEQALLDRAAPDQLKLAVMDLRGTDNMQEKLLGFLTNVVAETLDGLGAFKAISSQDISQMLAYESNKQLLGCDEASCLAEIGGALGADYLVSGGVSQVGDLYVVQLQLFNINQAKVEARASREHQGEPAALFEAVRTATKLLVREILGRRSGTLQLAVSEEGAAVKIDGAIVGTSPLQPIVVAGGTHTLAVEKEGFVVFQQDFEIQEKRALEMEAKLLPSEEYRREYREQAQLIRTVAIVSGGAGVLALGGGGLLMFDYALNQAGEMNQQIVSYNAQSVRTAQEYDTLQDDLQQMAIIEFTSLGLLGAGLVAGSVGLTMLLLGDDPDQYE